jgi:hypothetical protein
MAVGRRDDGTTSDAEDWSSHEIHLMLAGELKASLERPSQLITAMPRPLRRRPCA